MLELPSRVTTAASATVWSGPALAVGAVLFCTVIVTVSAADVLPPAVTVRLKVSVSVAFPVTVGAVKVGRCALVLLSVTFVPAVCVQA